MSRRYRKLNEDMPLFSSEDRGRYLTAKLVSSTSLYLHLPPSISLYFKDMHNNQINTNQKLVTFL